MATLWALSPAGTVLPLIFQTLKFSFLTSTFSLPHPIFPSSHRTFLTSSSLFFSSWLSVLSYFYGLSHSVSHFSPLLNPASHLISIPTSILNYLTSLLFPCTCPANPWTSMDFSICFLPSCSQAAELSSGKSPHHADYIHDQTVISDHSWILNGCSLILFYTFLVGSFSNFPQHLFHFLTTPLHCPNLAFPISNSFQQII